MYKRQILDHRWFISENEARYVRLDEAAESYFRTILPDRPDEARIYTADSHDISETANGSEKPLDPTHPHNND